MTGFGGAFDLSQLTRPDIVPDDFLLPAERRTLRIGGKAYFWSRETLYGPLTLSPGYAPGDPAGCQAVHIDQLSTGAPSWPRTCVIHRAHATRHLHKPTLDTPGEWWGTPPQVLAGGAIAVPGLGGMNITMGTEADRTQKVARGGTG